MSSVFLSDTRIHTCKVWTPILRTGKRRKKMCVREIINHNFRFFSSLSVNGEESDEIEEQ